MAELLLVAKNTYRRGEVVAVKPDGWVWGAKETPPIFEVVKLPGVRPDRLDDLLVPDLDETNDDAFLRRRKVKITDIAAAKLAELQNNAVKRENAMRAVLGDYDDVVVG